MNLNLAIDIILVTFILINSSSHLSFAKTNNDNLKGQDSQNKTNVLNDTYPNNYYICGYPKQLITNYSFLEKINCD
jgi:hypothetical protein